MTVTLRDVTKDNYDLICDLEVSESQEDFVSINAYTLAQAYYEGFTVQAIYHQEIPIGLIMWTKPLSQKIEIWRLMIDQNYQSQGFGRKALTQAIARIIDEHCVQKIEISYDPTNHLAKEFYRTIGFIERGMDADNEEMLATLTVMNA